MLSDRAGGRMTTDQDSTTASAGAGTATTASTGAGRSITHRPDEHRFVLTQDGADLAHLEYVIRNDVWFITHTFTEPAARGNGLAAQVTSTALEAARDAGIKVRAICPFVADYIGAHPEYQDLLVGSRTS